MLRRRKQQHLIVCSGKPEAYVTIIKDSTQSITLLKVTTDRHKASHGLSATELPVLVPDISRPF